MPVCGGPLSSLSLRADSPGRTGSRPARSLSLRNLSQLSCVGGHDVRGWAPEESASPGTGSDSLSPPGEVGGSPPQVSREAVGAARRPLRLLVYTDNRNPGGADLSLSHLVAALDPQVDVAVLGVSGEIVEWVGRGRPGVETAVVPEARSDHDWRSLRAHCAPFARSGRTSFMRISRARGRASTRSPRRP